MKEISFFLNKYENIGSDQEIIKNSLIKSIKENCGIVVDKKDIKINPKSISVDIQGPQKTEIFLKNQKIQENFNEKIKEKGIKIDEKKMF